jgi:plasmid stabilization system protein ParE
VAGAACPWWQAAAPGALAQVIYSKRAVDDLERAIRFVAEQDPTAAAQAAVAIREAVEILSRHPLIGRPVARPLRELVISFGKTGYVALYRFLPQRGEVRILGIRHQRELDSPPV